MNRARSLIPSVVLCLVLGFVSAAQAKPCVVPELSKASLSALAKKLKVEVSSVIPAHVLLRNNPSDVALALLPRISHLVNNTKRIEAAAKSAARTEVFNPMTESDIMIFFREETAPLLVREGFQNYHQTGYTHGDSTLSLRANLEDHLLGKAIEAEGYGDYTRERLLEAAEKGANSSVRAQIKRKADIESPYNRFRPKSAYLVVRDSRVDIGSIKFENNYGHYGALLKNKTKARATWTPTDSLAAGKSDVFLFNNQPVKVKVHGDKDVRYYLEAQIWGDLGLEDVEYWIVPKEVSRTSTIYQLLEKTGIPIKRYQIEDITYPSGNWSRRPIVLPEGSR